MPEFDFIRLYFFITPNNRFFFRLCIVFPVSKPAPGFEGTAVVNGEITQLSLANYLGKYVILMFYPLDL